MKKMMVLVILLISSFGPQALAQETDLLICQEKFGGLRVYKDNDGYKFERLVVQDFVRGNDFVTGQIGTTSNAFINNVVSVSKSVSQIIFKLDGQRTLSFQIVKFQGEDEEFSVLIKSSDTEIEDQISEILGVEENPLVFQMPYNCEIK